MSGPARSIVVERPGAFRLVEAERPDPGPGEVRVRVHAAGVCASDRELFDGTRPADYARYPVVPGHEWSGTVDAVGEGVDPALVGRGTVAEGFRACQRCERCRAGEQTLCTAGYAETGFTEPGAFADYLVLPARLLHPLAPDVDLTSAALLEPAAVVAAAVLRGAPRAGERIAVLGCGTLGLLAVQLLSAATPVELLAVDPRPRPLELAGEMGATRALTPEQVGEGPGAFDLVVETAGAPGTAADACRLARRGGRVVLTGVPEPGALGLDPVLLLVNQLTVAGIFGAAPAAWSYAVHAFNHGLLRPKKLVSHQLSLASFGEAMRLVGSGDPEVGKVLLMP
ncbi:alcohol dehydrogenase catalytic domain-containing protein [Streptomyces sp. 3MP-14]|uniref:2-deoxy-scyllo-inosamine dehydrogenase n=1 Tax=Streptomyces mimosae TaxID=2586635 RepID=A0A5N6AT16_9ACTN|nr:MULTISPECIES: alcohol dehydrogenase catalytic domain-containing protein [Streptomyces]KAB8170859.1 alcohol dehydrogenase catalytic domain-containing protein [Streptomyces mimosae]KAB8179789.1 alcohol dehydrogenase catalytic domain-containing protein [Streptomyces sp. 3MP-14]